MKIFSVAIDGPAGSGKSTVARQVAQELDLTYLDTGAMYRAIAWQSLDYQIDIQDETAVAHIAQITRFDIGSAGLLVNGEQITQIDEMLRTPVVSQLASEVAKYPTVRSILVAKQQEMAKRYQVVMDGRDIGTVVLPDAEIKIFLTASIEERAYRRYTELQKKGYQVDLPQLQSEIHTRDVNDQTRSVSPLKQAEDAILIDTTKRTVSEIVKQIMDICCTKMGGET